MSTCLQVLSIWVATCLFGGQAAPNRSPADAPSDVGEASGRVRIEISPSIEEAIRAELQIPSPRPPRVVLLLAEVDGPIGDLDPLDAPFFRRPQPIRSIPLDLETSGPIDIDDRSAGLASVPESWSDLQGRFKIQAVLDLGRNRSHASPGNPISRVATVDFDPNRPEVIELKIDRRIPAVPSTDADDLVWIERPSPMLTEALGRPVSHRVGVVLPPDYRRAKAERRFWPVIYRIPGFGGNHTTAEEIARMYRDPTLRHSIPRAVWVVLDPEDVLGHHGFVDGDNVGPRGTALVEELIPWLERRFRLVSDPSARILYGHSSGGWSALWLLTQHPEVFNSAFASAPDPVDFSQFGTVDLYTSPNLYVDDSGDEHPSYRRPIAPELDRVAMTIRQEIEMEAAIAPDLRSGEQWGAWNAMFSGRDPKTGRPRIGFDSDTGRIDHGVIRRDWSRFDLAALAETDPQGVGRTLREHARILCGDRDSFYLERAVVSLRETLDGLSRTHDLPQGPGYIQIVPNATHGSVAGTAMQQWMQEIRDIVERAPMR